MPSPDLDLGGLRQVLYWHELAFPPGVYAAGLSEIAPTLDGMVGEASTIEVPASAQLDYVLQPLHEHWNQLVDARPVAQLALPIAAPTLHATIIEQRAGMRVTKNDFGCAGQILHGTRNMLIELESVAKLARAMSKHKRTAGLGILN